MTHLDSLTTHQITEALDKKIDPSFDIPNRNTDKIYKQASVLIPFVRVDDAWHILFIRRAESDRDRHSGQVAFVGGKAETIDTSVIDTALRETQEEIGIDPNHVEILGQLGKHYSVSHFEISPIVASLSWPYDLTLDPAEVSHTFTLPLSWLANENNFEVKYRQITYKENSSKEQAESYEQIPVVYFKEHKEELLWGATARMVISLINTLKLVD